jgi:hypothetical protein
VRRKFEKRQCQCTIMLNALVDPPGHRESYFERCKRPECDALFAADYDALYQHATESRGRAHFRPVPRPEAWDARCVLHARVQNA